MREKTMQQTTKEKYMKHALGFVNNNLQGKVQTDEAILQAIINAAPRYTAKSFNNLKAALSFYLSIEGKTGLAEKIKLLENPTVINGSAKKKPLKKKTLKQSELEVISRALKNKNDPPLISAFILAHTLGARPCEMSSIKQISEYIFFIKGAKKTDLGDRGTDRYIAVNPNTSMQIRAAIKHIAEDEMSRIQDRFNYLMKKIFKGRKIKATLYTLRHQFCGELKSSTLNIREIAYLMGHKSTRTMECYGYAHSGSGNINIKAAISLNEIKKIIISDKKTERQVKREKRFLKLTKQQSNETCVNLERNHIIA